MLLLEMIIVLRCGIVLFKLVSELYYKSLTDVIPYSQTNVRIRYAANNNATAYAQGLDVRLNGEFIARNGIVV